jgi:hypothetical protein
VNALLRINFLREIDIWHFFSRYKKYSNRKEYEIRNKEQKIRK